jgi:hypothetical protein
MNAYSKFFIHDSDRVASSTHATYSLDPEPLSQALITALTTALLTTALQTTCCSTLG